MSRMFIGLGAVALVGWLVWYAVIASASHPTRLRWMLDDMVEGFNDADAGDVTEPLAERFRTEDGRVGRRTVLLALYQAFRDASRGDGSPGYRAQIVPLDPPDEDVRIDVTPGDSPSARIEVRVQFLRNLGKSAEEARWEPAAVVDFTAECAYENGSWLIVKASRKTRSGSPPF